METMYSIGEMAKLMGISAQMLRRYSNIGLIHPCYVNPENGYRFYNASNFAPIDRAKYLQKLGFSLGEIQTLYQTGDIQQMVFRLNTLAQELEEDIRKKQRLLNELYWYSQYFSVSANETLLNQPYIRLMPERYAFVVDRYGEDTPETGNKRLYYMKNTVPYKDLEYRRQNILLYDTDDFFQNRLRAFQYGLYLASPPPVKDDSHFAVFRAGYYICFRTKVLAVEEWSPEIFSHFFQNTPRPPFIIADEYENDLFKFRQCVYEVQLYFDQSCFDEGRGTLFP